MALVDVVIPTYNRTTALATTLLSLYYQDFKDFSITVSDQTEKDNPLETAELITIARLHQAAGREVRYLRNLPRKGIAQQRQFLFNQVTAPFCLFSDDDIIYEPFVLGQLIETIKKQQCGFVGNPLIGLSFLEDIREDEQEIEFWEGKVEPETITPNSEEWERYQLHNAANPYHIQKKFNLTPENPKAYKVAWVGGCVLYDTEKLKSVGGFSFWEDLPEKHAGEDVLAQLRVMKEYGGCGVLPSGVYHQELPTTILERDYDAPKVLSI